MVEAVRVCVGHVLRLVNLAEQTSCLVDSEFTHVNIFCFYSHWVTLHEKS